MNQLRDGTLGSGHSSPGKHSMTSWSAFVIYLRPVNFALKNALAKTYATRLSRGCWRGTPSRILLGIKLSLNTAISKCRAQEAARKQLADITSGLDGAQIRVVGKRQTENTTDRPQRPCAGCGYTHLTLASARIVQLSVLCVISVGA